MAARATVDVGKFLHVRHFHTEVELTHTDVEEYHTEEELATGYFAAGVWLSSRQVLVYSFLFLHFVGKPNPD